MSRCPDAQRAEAHFDQVLQQVHSIVDVQLHFIANTSGLDVACKHGPAECAGNIQQLCVEGVADGADERYDKFWQFVRCQDQQPGSVGDPELANTCLDQLGDWDKAVAVRYCWGGLIGRVLLRADAERTALMGVQRSCTIYLNHKKRCVHDGGQWYDCPGGSEVQDFVKSICDEYQAMTGRWPAEACGQAQ